MSREGGSSARTADGDVDGKERGEVGGRVEAAAVMGRERSLSKDLLEEAGDLAATPCAADRGRAFALAACCGSSCGSF